MSKWEGTIALREKAWRRSDMKWLRAAILAWVCFLALGLAAFCDRSRFNPADSCVLVYNEDGYGSGAVVDVNCVLTARHVADMSNPMIRTHDGNEHRVARVVKDPDSDMARLYIEGRFDERPLLFDPTPLRVGEEITVIGTPVIRELQNCVLRGRVVKVDVKIPDYGYQIGATNIDVLDTHAASGCSGGPVLDRGGVIRGVFIMDCGLLGGSVPVEELDVSYR